MKLITPEKLDEEIRLLRVLGYGQPGSGKTWFGASACLSEETSPVLFLEYKAQAGSLAQNEQYREAMNDGRLVLLRLEEYSELNHIWSWLNGSPRKELDKLFDGGKPKTLVLDSVTELQRREVLRAAGNDPDKFVTSIEKPRIQDWGNLLNQFALLANLFYGNLDMHVIFLALEAVDYKREKDSLDQTVAGYRVALQGQAQDQVPAYAYTLMRLVKAADNLKWYNEAWTRSGKAVTKEQVGKLPARIPNPSVPLLVSLLNKGGGEESKDS